MAGFRVRGGWLFMCLGVVEVVIGVRVFVLSFLRCFKVFDEVLGKN